MMIGTRLRRGLVALTLLGAVAGGQAAYGHGAQAGPVHAATLADVATPTPEASTPEATPTPEDTSTPEATPMPEDTSTPETAPPPEDTPVPDDTATPEPTPAPDVQVGSGDGGVSDDGAVADGQAGQADVSLVQLVQEETNSVAPGPNTLAPVPVVADSSAPSADQ